MSSVFSFHSKKRCVNKIKLKSISFICIFQFSHVIILSFDFYDAHAILLIFRRRKVQL